jgi:hypothetical protein
MVTTCPEGAVGTARRIPSQPAPADRHPPAIGWPVHTGLFFQGVATGAKYVLTLIVEASRYAYGLRLVRRSEANQFLRNFIDGVELLLRIPAANIARQNAFSSAACCASRIQAFAGSAAAAGGECMSKRRIQRRRAAWRASTAACLVIASCTSLLALHQETLRHGHRL